MPACERDTARDDAVRIVDARHGYTFEFSSSPEAHRAEYGEQERVERMARALAANNGPHQGDWTHAPNYFDTIHPNWQDKYRRYAERVLEAFDA